MEQNIERVLVSEDVLFSNPLKLREIPIIQSVIKILESIDVKLYIDYNDTYFNYWNNVNFIVNKFPVFYTNTNLMVKIQNVSPKNGSLASVFFFTNDKKIDIYYGVLRYDGGIKTYNDADEELKKCVTHLHKYIHPRVYLDYYMYQENEDELNEIVYATSLVNALKEKK